MCCPGAATGRHRVLCRRQRLDLVGPGLFGQRKAGPLLNWTEYLDRSEDNKSYPSLLAFSKATGIAVDYTENIDDNDTYVAKVAPLWRARKDFGADPGRPLGLDGQPDDDGPARGAAGPLPNPQRQECAHRPARRQELDDPGRRYSLPWQSGFAGLANTKKLGRDLRTVADSVGADLKGRVTLLSEMRDTVGPIMLAQGTDVSKPFDKTAMERGFDEVRRRIADGYVRRVRGLRYRGTSRAATRWPALPGVETSSASAATSERRTGSS